MIEVREWDAAEVAQFFRVPSDADDKYSRGVVALRTGSDAYPGAAVLGVEAAWRTGAGFVRHVSEGRVADAVIARRPETVVGVDLGRTRIDAWVVGSGTDADTRTAAETQTLEGILAGEDIVVVDAGALDLAVRARAPRLLTPHAGEFARMQQRMGLEATSDLTADVVRVAERAGATVLLKGARTLIADAQGKVLAVTAGTGWLATAGTGDVLAGVLGAVIAANPGRALGEVAAAGAWLHGRAARISSGVDAGPGRPIVAMDVAEALPHAIAELLA